jgi:hypothetical protein
MQSEVFLPKTAEAAVRKAGIVLQHKLFHEQS